MRPATGCSMPPAASPRATTNSRRTQLAGMPAGAPRNRAAETLFMVPRVGGAAGVGVEVALTPHWAARLEYLFTDYGIAQRQLSRRGAQRFNSDLACPDAAARPRLSARQRRHRSRHLHHGTVGARPRSLHRARTNDLHRAICRRRSARPIAAPTASLRTPGARPGTPRCPPAFSCGRAPNCGSIRRSTRASG